MTDVRYLEINLEEEGQRLDNYLLRVLKGVPRSHVYRIVRGGEVRVNKKRAKVSLRLSCGDMVRIPPLRISETQSVSVGSALAKSLQESIIYEDDALLVINKPSGLAVHGGSGLSVGVIEALRKTRQDLPYLELVHRLDKETSGCLLLAKKRSMLRAIQALLETRQIKKTYWAVLCGVWEYTPSLQVNLPLKKNTLQSGERIVVISEDGKESNTNFKLLAKSVDASWVEVTPKTGRTHQIRVHSSSLGHPIIGDHKYSQISVLSPALRSQVQKPKVLHSDAKRLYLHARSLSFQINGKDYCFTAEVDSGYAQMLLQFK
jgi:23S rRNA pseudouridine955/2504/2580 synthase